LYAHVDSKQDLLVEVVEEGARLFQESAQEALLVGETSSERLRALIAGHVGVVLDNPDVVRTFLNEARMLDEEHRSRVIAARDGYEMAFREVIASGVAAGEFRSEADPKITSILILSILNAIERWYRPSGEIGRDELVDRITDFVLHGLVTIG
jgi:AcrR family transcriptional regulator